MEITKEKLHQLYVVERKTTKQVGEVLGVSRSTIVNRMRKYEIPIRKVGSRASHIHIPKEELEKLYVIENKTSSEIGKIYNLHKTSIVSHLKKHGIKLKPSNGQEKIRDTEDEKIKKLYIEDGLSTIKIAELYGVDHKTIWNRLNKIGVERRALGGPTMFKPSSYKEYVDEETSGEYAALGDFINTTSDILMKHHSCGFEWISKPRYFLEGARCPSCSESRGENRISKYLQRKGYIFQKEFYFEDCRSIKPLRFDFGLFDNGKVVCLIEYQGEQHYRAVKYFGGEKNFKIQQEHDTVKRNYCRKNKIPLIEIPYTEKNIEDFLEMALNQKIGKQLELSIL